MVGREADGVWVTLKEVVHAAPGEVAAAIADSTGLCRWLAVGAEVPEEPGGTVVLAWDREWKQTSEVELLALDAALRHDGHATIRLGWHPDPLSEAVVPVEITVSPLPDRGGDTGGARVILRHGPFDGDADALLVMAHSAERWRWYLCNLRAVLEAKHDMRAIRPL
ncbi:MAG: hypothetical protein RIS86_561 [Planctomycetota bacterium]